MSFYSISNNLPEPFPAQISKLSVPWSGIMHVSASQNISGPSTVTLTPGQCAGPLILSGGPTVTLPTSVSLFKLYGGHNNGQIPGVIQKPNNYSQVSIGDIFAVPILYLGGTGGGLVQTNPADVGSTGTVTTHASNNPTAFTYIFIQFTGTPAAPSINIF